MRTRLTERDLSRIVKRVINEGVPINLPYSSVSVQKNLDSHNGKTGTFKGESGKIELYDQSGKLLMVFVGTGAQTPTPTDQNQSGQVTPKDSWVK